MGFHGGRKTRKKTRVGQSEGFQKLNCKRNMYSGHRKGCMEVANTTTPFQDNESHPLRHRFPDSGVILQIQQSPSFASRVTSPLGLTLVGRLCGQPDSSQAPCASSTQGRDKRRVKPFMCIGPMPRPPRSDYDLQGSLSNTAVFPHAVK